MADPETAAAPARPGTSLLERDTEIDELAALVRDARTGDGRVVLVEGPAGIGKSRLLAEARRRASASGVRVLTARGSELEREFPFGVVRQLFEPPLMDEQLAQRALAGSAAAARPIFEALDESLGGAGDAGFAALHGLYWLAVNLTSGGPVLLSIDDLHWCDRPSLRFVAYLAHRLEGLPLLLAATLRPAEPGADAALLAEIATDPLAVAIRPAPLTQAGADQLVRERLGTQPGRRFGTAVHEVTGGNPLLVHELLKVLHEEGVHPEDTQAGMVRELGPRAASRSVLLRLARLSPDAIAVARTAAVLGDGADLRRVASLAGLDEEAAARATGTLSRAEILRPEAELAFVHPLVRAAVYEDVPPAERQRQHALAARMLADMGAAEEQVAAHMLAMPRSGDPWVVETLSHAARIALGRGASESAVAYLQRALEEPPAPVRRPQLLLELGAAQVLVSAPAAVAPLRAAYDELRDPAARGVAAEALVRTLTFTHPPADTVAVARQAAAELPAELFDLRQAIEAMELIAVHFGADDTGYAPRFERARADREGDGPGSRMLAAAAAWNWALTGGSAEECSRLALEALADGVLLAADPAFTTVVAAVVLVLADREEALEVWDEMMADAHRRGSLFGALGVHLWRGWTLTHRGELGEAEASLTEAREEAILWGSDAGAGGPYVSGILGRLLVERGDLTGARQVLAHRGNPAPSSDGDLYCLRAEVELLLAEDRPDDAVAAADLYAQRLRTYVNPAWAPWRTLKAQALGRLGRDAEAIALAREELDPARRWGSPSAIGRALRVLGTLEREDGLTHLGEAIAVLDGSPARLELAKALAAYGSALRLARQPTEAREPLRRALELAGACESPPLVRHVSAELHASGARPRREAASGVGALTASEQRVAGLAAGGKSNRDIAQTLYVTPKTVEVHLSNAYRKLGIRSRRELVCLLEPS
jgi:DNA-binding CsgD family transcriptional regulator/tetratricopeptide (TPR) repeat protein